MKRRRKKRGKGVYGIGVEKGYSMNREEKNIIHFIFRLMESVEVQLKGTIEHSEDGIYFIKDIRPAHKDTGSLLPPVRLRKVEGVWVHSDSLKPSNLSMAIGRVLDSEDGRGSAKG